ncbi:hypothetical protein NLJ89_g11690 [Agrocybe chaxingu]|uniref:DUF4100 domain-containing protein n=1 Tax=Agrocybe chaxingu TaxID=84603 RepID=A0A9W8JPK6_9AGAR|nr:hypothetical protein NLJ89_g11690 [Agrocybe chaxingu]
MEPYKRDQPRKSDKSPNHPSLPKNSTAPVPTEPARVTIDSTPTVIPNPPAINTQDGWKEGRSGNSKDIKMKDAKDEAKKGAPQFHFTSDLQEQVSFETIQNTILDQKVSLSVREILGISPVLQKRFAEATKTRREYSNKSGEYDLLSPEAERLYERMNCKTALETHRTLYIPDVDEFQSFLISHSNAVQVRPTRLLAMTTGIFTAKFCDQSAKFMIDTGSELNLIPERLLSIPGLALDFEGSRWALKGINGAPVALRGCCMDVPVRIGVHNFDHHFFVSREDMRGHDVILGQPWIQWYAAQIDYDREGAMKMKVWEDGDRSHPPTLQLHLTVPDDPRNITTLAHTHTIDYVDTRHHQSATVEEVFDDEDF